MWKFSFKERYFRFVFGIGVKYSPFHVRYSIKLFIFLSYNIHILNDAAPNEVKCASGHEFMK